MKTVITKIIFLVAAGLFLIIPASATSVKETAIDSAQCGITGRSNTKILKLAALSSGNTDKINDSIVKVYDPS